MNFCKDNDRYISLYLDGLLDNNEREEFLKHIEICSECSAKLKETSYIIDLCREDKGPELPENFSASLHKRLLEEKARETKHKWLFKLTEKKLIAGLSTAAVLVVSLLAYNLMPQSGSMQKSDSMAYSTTQAQDSEKASGGSDKEFGSSETENKASKQNEDKAEQGNNSVSDNQKQGNSLNRKNQSDTGTVAANNKQEKTLVGQPSANELKNSKQPGHNQNEIKSNKVSGNEVPDKPEFDAFLYRSAAKIQTGAGKYVSNYAELNLKVSQGNKEISEFKTFMEKLGAVELKDTQKENINNSIMANQSSTVNQEDTSAAITAVQAESKAYIDYKLPLSLYSTVEAEAAKYKLELSVKTDIIIKDVTEKYDILNKEISEVDNKVTEASKKGEDISGLEAEKDILIQEKNNLYPGENMITVRIYYSNK
jgi:hypothetical protein